MFEADSKGLQGMFVFLAALLAPVPYNSWFPGTSSIDELEIIPPAYRGRWAPSRADCEKQDAVEVLTVKRGGVDSYEAGARLERVTQAGQERTIKVRLSYEGEGRFWDRVETWQLNSDGSKLSITNEGESSVTPLVKC
jgi:hypothetical protein